MPPNVDTAEFTITTIAELALDVDLPDAQVNEAYEATLETVGGTPPLTFSAVGLPAGLSLDPNTGVVSGTPIVVESNVQVQFSVTDSGTGVRSQSDTASATLRVRPQPASVATTTLPDGAVSEAYDATLEAAGGLPPYSFTISAGLLPDGLQLDGATGMISGTPTAAGTATFTVRVTDSDSPETTGTQELSIVIE